MFGAHIERVLDAWGVLSDTKAALYDLYVAMGDEVVEVFADLVDEVGDPASVTRADLEQLKARAVERYLRRNHPSWLLGKPTASFWHPRELEGRAAGLAMPTGDLPGSVALVIGGAQPVPDGVVIVGQNAHSGGRQATLSFDVVPRDLGEAIAVARAAGQQHTIPGSVGETSATHDAAHNLALIWEIQPNVFKPEGERNREIAKVWRKHRNWHLATLTIAIEWFRARHASLFVLRGSALAVTHEVNAAKPVSQSISLNHDRTVTAVIEALGLSLAEVSEDDEFLLIESSVMNHALRKHVLQNGAAGVMWKVGG